MVNAKKYKNTILYFCEKLGGKVEGKKKLAKLLYFADFDMFEYKESMKTITGDFYIAEKMGPLPNSLNKTIEEMVKSNDLVKNVVKIGEGYADMEVFETKVKPDISVFSKDEKFILDRVIGHYGKLNGTQLEKLTHAEAPWNGVDLKDKIPFELAFYRETSF